VIYRIEDKIPRIAGNVFIAPSANVIGNVTIDEFSSVWFNCTIRGDGNYIQIGKYCNIQDNSVIHIATDKYPTIIHDSVTIGHNCVIHACTLEEFSFIGISATILDNAHVNKYALVAAGALVPPGFEVPSYTLVAGVPAKVIRELKESEIKMIENTPLNYAHNAAIYRNSLKST